MNVELHFRATILLTSLTLTLLKRIFVSKFLEQCPNLITFQLSYSKFFENKSLWEDHLRFVGFRYTITHLKTELDYFHSSRLLRTADESKSWAHLNITKITVTLLSKVWICILVLEHFYEYWICKHRSWWLMTKWRDDDEINIDNF